VEVEDGYAADRDTRRVTGLGPAAAGDRVVLALHRDRVTVAHVLETEGRGGGDLGLGRGVVGEGCPDQVVVGSPGRPIGLTSEGAHVLKAEGWRVGDLGQVPRPCDEPSACVTGAVHAVVVHVVNGASVQDAVFVAPLHAVAWLELGHSVIPFSLSVAPSATA